MDGGAEDKKESEVVGSCPALKNGTQARVECQTIRNCHSLEDEDLCSYWDRCGLVEEVYHWGVGFETSRAKSGQGLSLPVCVDSDVELSVTSPAPCLVHAAILPAILTVN